jgi:predicted transcriptional regulator of viral defense system
LLRISRPLAEQVAAPSPAYVSLPTALFRHGLIEQVPEVIYAITLGRARRVKTLSGSASLHRMPPNLFGGYEVEDDGAKTATAEKALFDFLYLSPTRSRLFSSLPEIEVPRSFRWSEVARWTKRIAGKSRRAFVERRTVELKGGSESIGQSIPLSSDTHSGSVRRRNGK